MNCHAVLGGVPRRIHRDSPQTLVGLSSTDAALVRAGQEVRVPSIISDIKAPFIGRDALLPHTFWGVCSNCHSIVHADTGPSPEQLRKGIGRAQERLLAMDLGDRQIAFANPRVATSARQYASYVFGGIAFLFLVASLVYPAMEEAARRNPQSYAGRFDTSRWARLHEWSGMGLTVSALLHWLLSPRGNTILHLSLLTLMLLAVLGIAQKPRSLAGHRPILGWVHAQRYLTYLLVGLILAGHLAVSAIWL